MATLTIKNLPGSLDALLKAPGRNASEQYQ